MNRGVASFEEEPTASLLNRLRGYLEESPNERAPLFRPEKQGVCLLKGILIALKVRNGRICRRPTSGVAGVL